MIDIHTESLIAIKDIPAHLPGRVHIASGWRWIQRGCRGVKLETAMIGGKRYGSPESLQRFAELTTAAADGTSTVKASTPSAARKRHERGNRELDAAGK